MKCFKFLLAVSTLGLFSQFASAGWLFQPSIGYNSGTYDWKAKEATLATGTDNQKGTTTGAGLGMLIGYHWAMPYIGIDLGYASLADKNDSTNAAGTITSLTNTDAYIYTGLKFGMDFNARWGAYLGAGSFSSTYSSTSAGVAYDAKLTGTAMKVGGTFAFNPKFRLYVDYTVLTPVSSAVTSLSVTTTTTLADNYSSLAMSSLGLGVSYTF